MSEPTTSDYVRDLLMGVTRLDSIVKEVDELVADGNLDGAAMVLGSQTGKVHEFTESYAALQKNLRRRGGRARAGTWQVVETPSQRPGNTPGTFRPQSGQASDKRLGVRACTT
jgi:hypothetical protein